MVQNHNTKSFITTPLAVHELKVTAILSEWAKMYCITIKNTIKEIIRGNHLMKTIKFHMVKIKGMRFLFFIYILHLTVVIRTICVYRNNINGFHSESFSKFHHNGRNFKKKKNYRSQVCNTINIKSRWEKDSCLTDSEFCRPRLWNQNASALGSGNLIPIPKKIMCMYPLFCGPQKFNPSKFYA